MARSLGNPYALYIATTSPAGVNGPFDEADPAYTRVGQIVDLDLDGEREEIQATDRDGTSVLAGSNAYTITGSINFDPTGATTGQDELLTAYGNGNTHNWLISTGVAGETAFRGTGKVLNISAGLPTNEAATLDFSLGGEDDFVVGAAV